MNGMNISSVGIAFAMAGLASRFPDVQRQIEIAQQIERDKIAQQVIGASRPATDRMYRFFVALAGSTVASNSAMIVAASNFHTHYLAKGNDAIPTDIQSWAKEFWQYSAAGEVNSAYIQAFGYNLFVSGMFGQVMNQFIIDAERVWRETET